MDEVTTADAAALAGVTRQAIAQAVQSGSLRARKLNPTAANSPLLIDRRSLEAWIKKRGSGKAP